MAERNTTHAQRVAIVERHQRGETLPQIARSMQVHHSTVRKWWRVYREQGWAGLVPRASGPPVRGALSDFDPLVKYVALRLKRQHPAWGLDVLLLELRRRPSLAGKRLPGRTTLYTYLRSFYPRLQEHRRPRSKAPSWPVAAVEAVHQRWQMDFKGDAPIAGLGKVRPFIVCDEYSSAPLAAILHRSPTHLTFRDVQADLRSAFTRWGLPDQLRMDRDPLWVGSTRLEWPGTVLLWLVGLGVEPVINRPHRPTDNAQVERCNRTWNEHVALGSRCTHLQDLQHRSDLAWQDRREHLPSRNRHCHGLPPLHALPQLAQPRRPFTTDDEATLFDLQRVYTYLAAWQWSRKVDVTGAISLADCNRRVSRDHVGQIVKVHFDLLTHTFVACAVDGTLLQHFTLPIISQAYILGTGGT